MRLESVLSECLLQWELILHHHFSGECNPVNWLIQTMRNLTNEYLNLNFVTTPKLTPLHSFFAEKVFILFDSFISVSLLHTMDYSLWIIFYGLFASAYYGCVLWIQRPSFFDTNILQHVLSDLKFSTRSVTVDIFD